MTKKKKGKKTDPKTVATKAAKKQETTKTKEASEQADREAVEAAAENIFSESETDNETETKDTSEESTEKSTDEEPAINRVLSEIKRDFWITLSAEDKAERGQQYARMEIEIERERDYQKIEKDRMKEKLNEMTAKSRKLRDAYLSGEEQVEVTCKWQSDYQRGKADLIRSDSGANVQTRDLTSLEQREYRESLQGDLFKDENGKPIDTDLPEYQIKKDDEQKDVYHIVIGNKQIGSLGIGNDTAYYAIFQPADEDPDTAESLGTDFDNKQAAINKVLEKYADYILKNDSETENKNAADNSASCDEEPLDN